MSSSQFPFLLLQISNCPEEIKQIHASTIKTGSFQRISSRLLSLYSNPKIGNLEYARSVFDRISEPNSLCWNTIIKCYVENNYSQEALVLFSQLLHESFILPDSFTYPSVIKGCGRLNAIEEGKQIQGLAFKCGFGGDMFVQSSLLSLYSKCGEIDLARTVFDKMSSKDLVSWNCLIAGYVRSGDIGTARELFDQMPERDLFSWTALVDGYSKSGKVETAREIFDLMPERNVVSWNAMIDGYMKSRDFVTAETLFNKMPVKSLVTWNLMISGFVFNNRFLDALSVFKAMLKEDVKANDSTLVSAMSAVSGLGLLENGIWIRSYMDKNGFGYDGVLGTSLIDMYSKCGSIESALSVFHSISRKKLGHWSTIIVGLGLHGMAKEALELFEEMKRVGLRPHGITFIGLLNACSHAGKIEQGLHYFQLMVNEHGINPTVEHYGCVVDLLCRAGQLEEAKNVIDKMPMEPNEIIWMSLLSGCRSYGNVDLGEFAAKHVIELDPMATGCYVLLSNIYAAAGLWDQVSELRKVMKMEGVMKDPGRSSIEYGGEIHSFVVGDKNHHQTKDIYSKLEEMKIRLKSSGYIPDTTQVLLCLGEKDKEVELAYHSERLAIAFGLINYEKGKPIRVMKNLRVCNDCHVVTKLLSIIYSCEIIVRDNRRFHHFKNGLCSCRDYW
ncbi:pentatricopeptide repeat-containing protein At5g48910-like [Aristolochia californica]|uniref:pentatricopeptide repeat-containing protein At5g48910-like n=1 Tax=Aristolochia californica TaxID=171875 RepID=UPI0035D781E9